MDIKIKDKRVIFNDDEYQEILQHLNHLVEEADDLPYPNAKELIFSILKYFDSLHREPFSRIMNILDEKHPELRPQLEADFSINTLLGLYDLKRASQLPQLETKDQVLGFVPLEEVKILNPVPEIEWLELGKVEDLEEQKLYPRNFERVNFLISRIGTEVYAVQNNCVDSILPMDSGKLEEHYLICPWHGCRYDLKTGLSDKTPKKELTVFPVEIGTGGLLKVGIFVSE